MDDWQKKRVAVFVLDMGSAGRLNACLRSVYAQDHRALEITLISSRFRGRGMSDIDEFCGYLAAKMPDLAVKPVPVRIVSFEEGQNAEPFLREALHEIAADYFMILDTSHTFAGDTAVSTLLQIACLHQWEPLAVAGRQGLSGSLAGETRPADAVAQTMYQRNARALFAALAQGASIPLSAILFRNDFFTEAGEDVLDYGRDMGVAALLRLACRGVTPAGLDREVTVCHRPYDWQEAPARTPAEARERYEARRDLYRRELVPALKAYPRETQVGFFRQKRAEYRAYLLQYDRLTTGGRRKLWHMRHPIELVFRQSHGPVLLDKLRQIGMLALLSLCLLRAGGLFTGAAAQAAEILLAGVTVMCFAAVAVVGLFNLSRKAVEILIAAVCGEAAP